MGRNSRFTTFVRKYSPSKPFTEATATLALSRWFYRGHGEKHLAMAVCDGGIGRYADEGPRRWRCPDSAKKYARWHPLRDHLVDDLKGLVFDPKTSLVPFVSVDIDRHSGEIRSDRHQAVVIAAGRHLQTISHIKWMVEVNPRNGSAKFFGFRRSGDHFTAQEARNLATRIRYDLIEQELCHDGNVEVFPDNCSAVFLPLRRDKVTIVDAGVLPRSRRKIRDITYYPERVFENIRVYSALNFLAWLHNGDNYDEETLISALRYSCAGLPDVLESKKSPRTVGLSDARSPAGSELGPGPVPAKQIRSSKKNFGANGPDLSEPDAFKRNWSVLLTFTREFFRANRRLPSVEDALSHLKENKLFSGDWRANETNRRNRVTAILCKIAETFDSSLLQGSQRIVLDPRIRKWCRCQFPGGISHARRAIDETTMTCRTKIVRVPSRFVEHCVGVIAFCLSNHLENKALPVNRIKAIWSLIPDAPSWNQSYFQVVRRTLEKMNAIVIFDRKHEAGKAWRWEMGEKFPGRPRESQATAGMNKRPSTEGARGKQSKKRKEENVYNTLYHTPLEKVSFGRHHILKTGPPQSIQAI